jgi:hypothetical protein
MDLRSKRAIALEKRIENLKPYVEAAYKEFQERIHQLAEDRDMIEFQLTDISSTDFTNNEFCYKFSDKLTYAELNGIPFTVSAQFQWDMQGSQTLLVRIKLEDLLGLSRNKHGTYTEVTSQPHKDQ